MHTTSINAYSPIVHPLTHLHINSPMAMEIQRLHVHILIIHHLQATDQWRPMLFFFCKALNSGTIGPKKNTMRGDNIYIYNIIIYILCVRIRKVKYAI
jgi:hypothetical protein